MQLYLGGSKVFGEYGDPWDFRLGVNGFPWKNTVVRMNAEYLQLNRSPVGGEVFPARSLTRNDAQRYCPGDTPGVNVGCQPTVERKQLALHGIPTSAPTSGERRVHHG